MKDHKIIIVSCRDVTDIMVDGKLYSEITAVKFSHNGGERVELELTGCPFPMVDNDPMSKAGFMMKIKEFSKEEPISVETVNDSEIFSRKGDLGEVHIKMGETEITRTKEGIFISAPKIDLGSVSEIKD